MMKKVLTTILAATMVFGLVACGGGGSATPSGGNSGMIKVGIINNDPNESGYRTANVNDLKNMFCEANGYDASFAYSLKNDEQINAAQQFIQNGVGPSSDFC